MGAFTGYLRPISGPATGLQMSAASAAVCRCMDAVIAFLAEAAAQATRRPHEPWELAQTLLAGSAALDEPTDACGVSGLAVCCLRNARKVAASSRMSAEARAAICGLVSGAFLMLRPMDLIPDLVECTLS